MVGQGEGCGGFWHPPNLPVDQGGLGPGCVWDLGACFIHLELPWERYLKTKHVIAQLLSVADSDPLTLEGAAGG